MIRNFVLALLTFITIVACSQSTLKGEIYTDSGGNEKAIAINLLSSGEFVLNREVWQPGLYEDRQSIITKGQWLFKNDKIMLEVNGEVYIADLITIGSNPLGLDENILVLHFRNNPANERIFLDDEILYPQE